MVYTFLGGNLRSKSNYHALERKYNNGTKDWKLSHNRGSFFLLIYFLFYWASYSILLSDNQTDEHQF
jgi:hypothetical protein